jgi:hypothetical protein
VTEHAAPIHFDVTQRALGVDTVSVGLLATVDYEKITAIRPETAQRTPMFSREARARVPEGITEGVG